VPLRAAVFDFGGVLARGAPEYLPGIVEEFGLTREEISGLFRGPAAVENTLAGQKFDIAEMRVAMTAALPARLGSRAAKAADRLEGFYSDPEALIPIAEIVDLLREVQAAGVPVGILSNGPSGVTEQSLIWGRAPSDDRSVGRRGDRQAAGGRVRGGRKCAAGRCPSGVRLIDDTQHHVDGARAAGMHAVLFEGDAGTVRAELRTSGLLPGEA
jgi:FMN phosphatase YigB (HAD superfamily)